MITNEFLTKYNLWEFSEQCVLAVADKELSFLRQCANTFPNDRTLVKLIRAWNNIKEYFSTHPDQPSAVGNYSGDAFIYDVGWRVLEGDGAYCDDYLCDHTIDRRHKQYIISVLKVEKDKVGEYK